MADVNALNGYTQTGQNSGSGGAGQKLSADMNTFLTLLTTQLKYQDPLDPMDTAEFTNQLVQYSSVEQSIQTNQKLESLLSLNMANLGAQAVSYIGKVAQVLGDVMPLENGVAKATYTFDKNVSSAMITVKDVNGKVVYSEQGKITSGTHEFTWDGKDSNGVQLEDGAYQIEVTSKVPTGEKAAEVMTTVFGKVTGVASDANGVYVGLGDAVTANLNNILTVRNDDYFDPKPEKPGDGDGDGGDGETPETPEQLPVFPEDKEDDKVARMLYNTLAKAADTAVDALTLGLI